MDAMGKPKLLSQASQVEAGEDGCQFKKKGSLEGIILTHAVLPNGKTTPLLKSLLTSVCENNCLYCPMRSARDFRRTTFKPEEFAQMGVNLTRAGLIQGIFLSSGVANGGVHTQDRLIATAEILRNKMGYRGYIHLKVMPGAEYDQILASMRLADRVSINLEAPNAKRLPNLAPKKNFETDLMAPIRMMNQIRESVSPESAWKGTWPSSCTQFVVGGADESDKELLTTTETLHNKHNLLRVYFSALTPHSGTPLANHPPIPKKREQRLYQADYLLRDYGFTEKEITYDSEGKLPLDKDPKLIWAEQHLFHQPIEINKASREMLLRVPGIGLKGVESILIARRTRKIKDLSNLRKVGVRTAWAQKFILINGSQPAIQPTLF